eukprot:scaffold647_cov411-Prasinococcus_capsulatus_cf.AAC.17
MTSNPAISPILQKLQKNFVQERKKNFELMVAAEVSEDGNFPFPKSPLHVKVSNSVSSWSNRSGTKDAEQDTVSTSTTSTQSDKTRQLIKKFSAGEKSVKSYRVQQRTSHSGSDDGVQTPKKPAVHFEPSSTRAYVTRPLPGSQGLSSHDPASSPETRRSATSSCL